MTQNTEKKYTLDEYRRIYELLYNFKPDEFTIKLIEVGVSCGYEKWVENIITSIKSSKIMSNETRVEIINAILLYAAISNQEEIFDLAITEGPTNYNEAFYQAIGKGHKSIVMKLVQTNKVDISNGVKYAALGNQKEMIQLCVDKGITDYNLILQGAAQGNHVDLLKWAMQTYSIKLTPNILIHAAITKNGDASNIMKWMLTELKKHKTSNLNAIIEQALVETCQKGNVASVKFLLTLYPNNIDDCYLYAVANGHKDIVEVLLQHEHNIAERIIDESLYETIKSKHCEMFKLITSICQTRLNRNDILNY